MNKLLKFAFPIMVGNLLQQLYNVVDTLIVGRYLGENALAAVGSSYTLMVFITSIIIGLCMGSSAFFSMQFGAKNQERLEKGIFTAFILIGVVALALNVFVYAAMGAILVFLRVPGEVTALMREYLIWIFAGIVAVFAYNFVASLLRAVGNSVIPLLFLCGCQYRVGYLVYQRIWMGRRRRGGSNGDFPVSGGRRYRVVLFHQISVASGHEG